MRVSKKFAVDALTLLGGETVVEEHLRIDISAAGTDRAHVILLAEASIRYIQEITGRTFVAGTATVDLEHLHPSFEVPFKASALTAVTYLAEGNAGTYTALDEDAFNLYSQTSPAVVTINETFTAPTDVSSSDAYPFRLTFTMPAESDRTTGESTQTSGIFKACALIYLAHLYENRQAVTSGGFRPYVMPLAFESFIKTLKRYS
jgi:hypothetical protein